MVIYLQKAGLLKKRDRGIKKLHSNPGIMNASSISWVEQWQVDSNVKKGNKLPNGVENAKTRSDSI
jgi:hypothetical protein